MCTRKLLFVIVFACFYQTIYAKGNYTLRFVQMIYRHGDRAPGELYRNDPNPETLWPLGLGELTELGKMQQYSLGKFFRVLYKDFFPKNPSEIKAMSSNNSRCIQSSKANLEGFFDSDNNNVSKLDGYCSWQQIPIFSFPSSSDKRLFNYLSRHLGKRMSWTSSTNFFDTLMIEKKYNLEVPKWAEVVFNQLKNAAATRFHFTFNSTLVQRLRAGPFLKLVKHAINEKIKGNTPNLKFITYSSHDANIGVITAALKHFQEYPVPYCSTIIFELYHEPEDNYYVRLLYLNSTEVDKFSQKSHILVLEGCTEFCPLNHFINFIEPFSSVDFDSECQITSY
ncbi:lysosomal acid phosphatase isoform X3 [Parasteatoda tepidariorum]|uniref:lysosomal acid phosphatase isoform X3 n=1 Tax=Parasteatoda tepidariorum TaxID=114398 RepID=UPI0039BCCF67